jgi:hypothetical protein
MPRLLACYLFWLGDRSAFEACVLLPPESVGELLGEDLKPGTQSDVVQDVARGGGQGTGPGWKGLS